MYIHFIVGTIHLVWRWQLKMRRIWNSLYDLYVLLMMMHKVRTIEFIRISPFAEVKVRGYCIECDTIGYVNWHFFHISSTKKIFIRYTTSRVMIHKPNIDVVDLKSYDLNPFSYMTYKSWFMMRCIYVLT